MNSRSRPAIKRLPKLPNHFKINIRIPDNINHETSLEVEVLSINDFYMDICTIANVRFLEILEPQYLCAIEDQNQSIFCLGKACYDTFMELEVITLFSLIPQPNN